MLRPPWELPPAPDAVAKASQQYRQPGRTAGGASDESAAARAQQDLRLLPWHALSAAMLRTAERSKLVDPTAPLAILAFGGTGSLIAPLPAVGGGLLRPSTFSSASTPLVHRFVPSSVSSLFSSPMQQHSGPTDNSSAGSEGFVLSPLVPLATLAAAHGSSSYTAASARTPSDGGGGVSSTVSSPLHILAMQQQQCCPAAHHLPAQSPSLSWGRVSSGVTVDADVNATLPMIVLPCPTTIVWCVDAVDIACRGPVDAILVPLYRLLRARGAVLQCSSTVPLVNAATTAVDVPSLSVRETNGSASRDGAPSSARLVSGIVVLVQGGLRHTLGARAAEDVERMFHRDVPSSGTAAAPSSELAAMTHFVVSQCQSDSVLILDYTTAAPTSSTRQRTAAARQDPRRPLDEPAAAEEEVQRGPPVRSFSEALAHIAVWLLGVTESARWRDGRRADSRMGGARGDYASVDGACACGSLRAVAKWLRLPPLDVAGALPIGRGGELWHSLLTTQRPGAVVKAVGGGSGGRVAAMTPEQAKEIRDDFVIEEAVVSYRRLLQRRLGPWLMGAVDRLVGVGGPKGASSSSLSSPAGRKSSSASASSGGSRPSFATKADVLKGAELNALLEEALEETLRHIPNGSAVLASSGETERMRQRLLLATTVPREAFERDATRALLSALFRARTSELSVAASDAVDAMQSVLHHRRRSESSSSRLRVVVS
jgi:hypothetical protein